MESINAAVFYAPLYEAYAFIIGRFVNGKSVVWKKKINVFRLWIGIIFSQCVLWFTFDMTDKKLRVLVIGLSNARLDETREELASLDVNTEKEVIPVTNLKCYSTSFKHRCDAVFLCISLDEERIKLFGTDGEFQQLYTLALYDMGNELI